MLHNTGTADTWHPGMMVMFDFKLALLAISSTTPAAEIILSLIEAQVAKQQTEARVLEQRQEQTTLPTWYLSQDVSR